MGTAERIISEYDQCGILAKDRATRRWGGTVWVSIHEDCAKAGGDQTWHGNGASRWRFADGSSIGIAHGSARAE